MKILLRWLLDWAKPKHKAEQDTKRIPKAGERWIAFETDSSPWTTFYYSVRILDVKDGWVRFSESERSDRHMTIDSFLKNFQILDQK